MSTNATPAAATTPTTSGPSTASSTPTTSKSSTSSGSPSGKPTPMTANQFRAALRGTETTPFQTPSVDDFEAPSAVDHQALENPDDGLQSASDEIQASEENTSEPSSDQVSDFSWAQSLEAFKDGLHGTPLADLLQALSNGQIPEALWDKLHIPLKDGDFEWSDTLANARNGAMMRAKFTQKMQEFAKEKQQFGQERQELLEYLGGWKTDVSGKALLNGLRRMGMPFDAMARAYAQEVADLEAMDPKARELFEAKTKAEAELEELKRNQARTQTQQTQERTQADTQRVAQAVKTAAAKSFETNGLQMTPGSWNVFREHLSALWTASGQEAPTMEMVNEAVLATKELVAQAQQQHLKAISQQHAVKAPLAGARTDAAGPRSVPKNSPIKTSVTAAEFRKRLNANPFGQ